MFFISQGLFKYAEIFIINHTKIMWLKNVALVPPQKSINNTKGKLK